MRLRIAYCVLRIAYWDGPWTWLGWYCVSRIAYCVLGWALDLARLVLRIPYPYCVLGWALDLARLARIAYFPYPYSVSDG